MARNVYAIHFWTWFKTQHLLYRGIITGKIARREFHLDELSLHIYGFHKSLCYEMNYIPQKDKMVLIITARRQARYFKKAKELIAYAPFLDGWEFMALTPPRPIDHLFEKNFLRTGLKPGTLSFELGPQYSAYDQFEWITVYVPDWDSEEEHDSLYEAVILIVQNLVGEEMSIVAFENIYILPQSEIDIENEYVLPIITLANVLAQMPSPMKVGTNGRLSLS